MAQDRHEEAIVGRAQGLTERETMAPEEFDVLFDRLERVLAHAVSDAPGPVRRRA